MKFDVEKMFEETRRTAKAYSEEITGTIVRYSVLLQHSTVDIFHWCKCYLSITVKPSILDTL